MKNIYIIAGLLFLASCGQAEVEQATITEVPATPETVIEQTVEEVTEKDSVEEVEAENPSEEINDEVAALETAVEDLSKTATIDASYTNPKGVVDMVVNYSLDSEGLITAIEVTTLTSAEKRIPTLNETAQEFVGSPLKDALNFKYKSGSSLAGGAFIAAIKSQL